MEKRIEIQSLNELDTVADYICELTKTNTHFCLDAEMGAGKTTLINLVCKKLGVKEHTSSPTYSIINEYLDENENSIYHLDLYRIKDEMELLDIGIVEVLEGNSICFIEWPEKSKRFLPSNYVQIEIQVKDQLRTFKITN